MLLDKNEYIVIHMFKIEKETNACMFALLIIFIETRVPERGDPSEEI